MRLYNSLTKQIEDFRPIKEGTVTMYSCGPTVYNNLHIGNLSAFVYADLLRRTLQSSYDVTAVMNITDVDDKTIRDSQRDYPELDPMAALMKLTQKYDAVFRDDVTRIGNDVSAITFVKATDTIAEMISLTQTLLDKGIAYIADDGVYFSIKQYEMAGYTYGVLQKLDRSHEHARIASDEYDKDHASDFALWKRADSGEPSWEATFTHNNQSSNIPGRPGWHIECSAMSQKLLGVPFDIHTGGIDLKFPHHENEIAQSRAATSKPQLANIFVHNNHVMVEGRKMSKSLGNVITLRDIEAKGFDPMAFRLLILSSHYQTESNFSWEILQSAQNRLQHWWAMAARKWQLPESNSELNIINSLSDNLNTPEAIANIDSYFATVEQHGHAPSARSLQMIEDMLGITITVADIASEEKETLQKRQTARDNNDWQLSDTLRDQLKAAGIGVNDTEHGQLWYPL